MRSPFWNLSTSAIALSCFFSTKGDRPFGISQQVRSLFWVGKVDISFVLSQKGRSTFL
ncbi:MULTISPECIES: hypothetical protein [unclassified Microcoleus]|uniref:hypothetical protein n=1 Tax=unclassified Microcoleus TaxID=2642155 RepID=UPI002FD22F2D